MSVFDNEHGYELFCECGYNYSGTSNTEKLIEAYLSMVRDVTERIVSTHLSCAIVADIATVRTSNDPKTIEAYVPRGNHTFDSLGPVVYLLPRSARDEC